METVLIHTINLIILGVSLLMVCISHLNLMDKVERLEKQIENLTIKTPSCSMPSSVTPFVNIV
jgi:hypothetical protein